MLQVKPVPPTPSITRPRPHFTTKGRASGLAVHVSSVAAQLGNTITGWLLSEFTAKSAQNNTSSNAYPLKKSDSIVSSEYGEPKAVFYTPKVESGPPSPGYLGIPLGRKRAGNPDLETTSTEGENEEEDITEVEMPRLPPPARTSPPPLHSLPTSRKSPTQFRESLPIAPKQLLPPISSNPMKKSVTQRKPTPIHIIPPPKSSDQVNQLPSLPIPDSNFSIPYSSALDSPPAIEYAAPPTPIVPSASRFDNEETPRQYPRRPKLQRTYSSSETKEGFTFDFPPAVPEKDFPRQRAQRKSRDARRGGRECMMDFIEEYVEMRKKSVQNMAREQRFPVAGQLMCRMDVGSVYEYPKHTQHVH
jgi:hypothetical protein